MNVTTIRLSLRLQRFELFGLGILVALASASAVLVAGQLNASGFGPACLLEQRSGVVSPGCEAAQRAFESARSGGAVGVTQALLVGLPFLLGAMAGVAVVGRDLERGTARLAWSLAPSRTRWFAGRVVPVLVVVLALSFAAGAAADRLLAGMEPGTDTANGFLQFGFRGVVLMARALFAFSIAVLVGAVIGRTLPALLVSAVIVAVGLAGGSMVHQRILAAEAVPLVGDVYVPENLSVSSGFLLPDGRVVGWDTIEAIDPHPTDGTEWIPKYPQVQIVVPGARYRFVELRETAALAAGSLVALLLAGLLVRRARPG